MGVYDINAIYQELSSISEELGSISTQLSKNHGLYGLDDIKHALDEIERSLDEIRVLQSSEMHETQYRFASISSHLESIKWTFWVALALYFFLRGWVQ